MNSLLITAVGLIAQAFYTARILVQWIKSEKAHQIESPLVFWVCSVLGSMFLFTYGWLRQDFSIIFGEFLSFYIYLWNLKVEGFGSHFPHWVKDVFYLLPVFCMVYILAHFQEFSLHFLRNDDVPFYALIWGSTGQFIYKMRFVYQWFYSVRRKQSLLPVSFWGIAATGSIMIIIYAVYRRDFVLLIGQVGIFASIRNIMIGTRKKH